MAAHGKTHDRSPKSIFLDALEISSAQEKIAFLDSRCGDDDGLRSEVEALLHHHGRLGDYLEPPSLDPEATRDRAAPPRSPDIEPVIGPYKLLEPIGEGGMGTVYMAEQTEPVRRRVALKVIKPGMDSKQVVARFEAERQALAMMDHPNIAKVHDAGMTPAGRPYFVMELVRGLPITEYCDEQQLSIPERLELFTLVCRAVQHAHQKGVIHRDLKPSNILVTVVDGVAVPKVIDFGVAKATGQALTDKTLFTGFHQFVGTPLYTSPEQAELSGGDVDTRSDIYALGVLLYELLTGTTPFDSETLRKAAFDEMRRIIREEEPPKPSTRLSSLGERLSTVSARRKADPRRLGTSLKGELDWVVMKALEKDRRRRYETASDFAADIMRYLTDRPVEAYPPSARYRFAKFVRRNRAALTTTALVSSALVAGLVASVGQAMRATAAERQTAGALARSEEHLGLARQAVDELYGEVAARWSNHPHFNPLPRPFLEKALPFYERFAAQPRVDASVGRAHRRVGEILIQLRRKGSDESLKRAIAIFEALLVVDPENPEHTRDLVTCHSIRGGTGIDQAIILLEQLAARFPGNDGDQVNLACRYFDKGDLHRAREIMERHVAAHPDDFEVRGTLGQVLHDIGNRCRDAGRLEEAEHYGRRALAINEEVTGRHPTRPHLLGQLALANAALEKTLLAAHKYEEVPKLADRAATIYEGLRYEYPDVSRNRDEQGYSLTDLARGQFFLGRPEEAELTLRRLDGAGRDAFVAVQLTCLAHDLVLGDPKRWYPAEAIKLLERSLRLNPNDSGMIENVRGVSHYRLGDMDAALRDLERGFVLMKEDPQHGTGFFLAMAYHRKGDREKARAWYDRAVRGLSSVREPTKRSLLPYRDEAAGLLGLKDGPQQGPEPPAPAREKPPG